LLSSLLLSEPKLQSIPVGLMGFISEYHAEFTQLCAGVLIACIPTLVLYAVMQENTIKGMTAGAVKG
jgi:raffinose/stachyose/melibiose transport system permease protein